MLSEGNDPFRGLKTLASECVRFHNFARQSTSRNVLVLECRQSSKLAYFAELPCGEIWFSTPCILGLESPEPYKAPPWCGSGTFFDTATLIPFAEGISSILLGV